MHWCCENHLQLHVKKTKEMVLDFRRNGRKLSTPTGNWESHVDNKLKWSTNTEVLYMKGLRPLFFFRWLRSFSVCNQMLLMFYLSVVTRAIFFAIVYWGTDIKARTKTD